MKFDLPTPNIFHHCILYLRTFVHNIHVYTCVAVQQSVSLATDH